MVLLCSIQLPPRPSQRDHRRPRPVPGPERGGAAAGAGQDEEEQGLPPVPGARGDHQAGHKVHDDQHSPGSPGKTKTCQCVKSLDLESNSKRKSTVVAFRKRSTAVHSLVGIFTARYRNLEEVKLLLLLLLLLCCWGFP